MTWLLLLQLWTSTKAADDTTALHAGNWQSCDGEERAIDHFEKGRMVWSLHLGPDDEFALYRGIGPEGEHDHAGPDNLLGPAYRLSDVQTFTTARQWNVPLVGLWLSVVKAGGSDPDHCQSFYVRVEKRR